MKLSERIPHDQRCPVAKYKSGKCTCYVSEVARLEARIIAEVKDGQAERSLCLQLEADKRLLMHVVHGRAMASSLPKHLKEE